MVDSLKWAFKKYSDLHCVFGVQPIIVRKHLFENEQDNYLKYK